MCGPWIAFMRIRAPSSAPPMRRRAGAFVGRGGNHPRGPGGAPRGGSKAPPPPAPLGRAPLLGLDRAAAPAVQADLRAPELTEPFDEIGEELHVAALVRRHRHG